MKPRISILLLTFNLIEHTQECLNSLVPCIKEDYELVIVDNGSTDGTPGYLMTGSLPLPSWLPVKLHFNNKNLGIAPALNQGMKLAQSDFIYWLQNDMILKDPDFFEKLYQDFQKYKKVGVVCSATNYVATKLQQCPAPSNLKGDVISVSKADLLSAMISKKCWEDIGGFDEGFQFCNYEDTDFLMNTLKHGYQILIDRNVWIYHKGSATCKKYKNFHSLELNRKRFLDKWGAYPEEKILELK